MNTPNRMTLCFIPAPVHSLHALNGLDRLSESEASQHLAKKLNIDMAD